MTSDTSGANRRPFSGVDPATASAVEPDSVDPNRSRTIAFGRSSWIRSRTVPVKIAPVETKTNSDDVS